jgi:osmotically-inducible protein OsmY
MTIQSYRRKFMKKTFGLTFTLLLMVAFALTQTSLASQEGEMKKKAELKSYSPNDIFNAASQEEMKKKADKPAKAAAAPKAPKTDADVQKCIADKFAASKTVTNGAAAVANGAATLTGEAKNAGAKGGATRTAKACGAKTVVNNMTTPTPPPAAAKTDVKKKAEPPKKLQP